MWIYEHCTVTFCGSIHLRIDVVLNLVCFIQVKGERVQWIEKMNWFCIPTDGGRVGWGRVRLQSSMATRRYETLSWDTKDDLVPLSNDLEHLQ
jgi:hypothetical protein